MKKSQATEKSHVDNFNVRSKPIDSMAWERLYERQRKKDKNQETGPTKVFLIYGVDFYSNEVVVQDQQQLLEDVYSVKGDYFYLKRGDIVNIRYVIGEYVEIKKQQMVGYFPARMIRLIQGQTWREHKSKVKGN